jgi:methyltransferase, FkbM family
MWYNHSQYGQDKIIDFLLKNKTEGIFVDIGAHDGKSLSNTYFFEKKRNWKGLCIEPNPDVYEKLKINRCCFTENCCITDKNDSVIFRKVEGYPEMLSGILEFFDKGHIERIDSEIAQYGGSYTDIPLKCRNINDLLRKYGLYKIDYCSIDTEGADEKIVKSIDMSLFDIKSFSIEISANPASLREYLKEKGYRYLKRVDDDLYIKKGNNLIRYYFALLYVYKIRFCEKLSSLLS